MGIICEENGDIEDFDCGGKRAINWRELSDTSNTHYTFGLTSLRHSKAAFAAAEVLSRDKESRIEIEG